MLVVGDLEDVFLPKPNDILVNLVEARAAIETLLGRLGDMFKDTHNVGSALGPALQAAFKLVVCPSRSQTSGSGLTIAHSLTLEERCSSSLLRFPTLVLVPSRTGRIPRS